VDAPINLNIAAHTLLTILALSETAYSKTFVPIIYNDATPVPKTKLDSHVKNLTLGDEEGLFADNFMDLSFVLLLESEALESLSLSLLSESLSSLLLPLDDVECERWRVFLLKWKNHLLNFFRAQSHGMNKGQCFCNVKKQWTLPLPAG